MKMNLTKTMGVGALTLMLAIGGGSMAFATEYQGQNMPNDGNDLSMMVTAIPLEEAIADHGDELAQKSKDVVKDIVTAIPSEEGVAESGDALRWKSEVVAKDIVTPISSQNGN